MAGCGSLAGLAQTKTLEAKNSKLLQRGHLRNSTPRLFSLEIARNKTNRTEAAVVKETAEKGKV